MTKRAIVYSKRSKIPRRIIVANGIDDERMLYDNSHVGQGEAIHVMADDLPITHQAARQAIAALHGIDHTTIPSGRCAVVDDQGIVVAIIMADPFIDKHHLGRLVAHDRAAIGDSLGIK